MQLDVGKIVEGKVTGITNFGAFIDLGEGKTGMVHISEVSAGYVKEIADHLKEGEQVKVKVLKVGDDGKISLSIKQAQPQAPRPDGANQNNRPPRRPQQQRGPRGNSGGFDRSRHNSNEPMSFEDMLSKFKQNSEEKMSDIKRNIDGKRGSYSRRGGGSK